MKVRHLVVATLIAGLALAHGVAGLLMFSLPSWKMFATLPRYEYTLVDNEGQQLDIRDFVPERAYTIVDDRSVMAIGFWIAQKYPERSPISGTLQTYDWRRRPEITDFEIFHDEDGRVKIRNSRYLSHVGGGAE